MDEVLGAVASPGQPLEDSYPYRPSAPATPLIAPMGDFELHSSPAVRSPDMQGNEIVKRALSGQAVGIVIQMTRSVFTPHAGVVDFDSLVIPDQYHALIVVGVGRHSASGDEYVLLRNSWGTSWGTGGHAWMSVSHLNLLLIEGFLI
jgi:hypothetical protein